MPACRRTLGPTILTAACLLGGGLLPVGSVVAAEAESAPLSVELAPVGPGGLAGLALLAAAGDGTSVQMLVVGAPPGTSAVVHAGDCAAIDPTPAGLLGDVTSGQLQVTLPMSLADLVDGAHVIVLHPGLDLDTALGCGVIPATGMPVPAASAAPLPVASLAATTVASLALASPTKDPACVGVVEWAEATTARLDALDALAAEANEIAGRFDLPAYVGAIEAFARAAEAASADQASRFIPDPASAANSLALLAYGRLLDAASLFQRYYTVEMSLDIYAQATSTYEEALGMVAEVRREIGRLMGGCDRG